MSDFKIKKKQRVRFWFKSFTTRQILDWKKNALDFEFNIFPHVRLWKTSRIQKITYWFTLLRENDIFYIFCAVLKSMVLNWKFNYVSEFELKKNTMRQNVEQIFYNVSHFECKILHRVRF